MQHKTDKHKEHYLALKHPCRKETRQAYQNYLADILNINNTPDHEYSNNRPNTKKLYSLLKHAKQDSTGIDSLKKNNKMHTSDGDKVTALIEQFQSVFTSKSPISLKSLAEMKIQDNADTGRETPMKSLVITTPCLTLNSPLMVSKNS
ncbi:hypothetical protein DPMN_065671 [Dreissena polymorpha]|uniref:Uncharacterized protein n=1 Tax=Dreissena polymorpha TaxID=45954 RepID=A0A9D3YVU3_DREPO|nr:hypothetical protein DPMN_065671 [Dreissena polymorpha]